MKDTTSKKLQFAKELAHFENKWVALVDKKIVASGESAAEVRQRAEAKGYREFAFYLVPSTATLFIPRGRHA